MSKKKPIAKQIYRCSWCNELKPATKRNMFEVIVDDFNHNSRGTVTVAVCKTCVYHFKRRGPNKPGHYIGVWNAL